VLIEAVLDDIMDDVMDGAKEMLERESFRRFFEGKGMSNSWLVHNG
jgi:hypothetical protein